MKMPIRIWLSIGLLASTLAVHAQERPVGLPGNYPSKPIHVVIATNPGGGLDIVGRGVLSRVGERWGAPFVFDNRSGVNVALDLVARSAPDGYTLLISAGSLFFQADQLQKVAYDVRKKFAPVAGLTSSPFVLAVNNNMPVSNLAEFIAYTKAHPNSVNYAYVSGGSDSQLAGELLKLQTGIDMQGIAYKGVGPAYIEQMAGRIHLTFGTTASSMPQIKAGNIKPIAVTSRQRSKVLPNIPSINETLPTFDNFSGWVAVFAAEGTPAPIVNALNKEINAVLGSAEVQKFFAQDGSEVIPGPPEQLRDLLATSLETSRRVMKQANIKYE